MQIFNHLQISYLWKAVTPFSKLQTQIQCNKRHPPFIMLQKCFGCHHILFTSPIHQSRKSTIYYNTRSYCVELRIIVYVFLENAFDDKAAVYAVQHSKIASIVESPRWNVGRYYGRTVLNYFSVTSKLPHLLASVM